MQPVMKGPLPPVVEASPKSLEKVPTEVKLMILSGLDITEIPHTAVLNKSWLKLASDKRLWVQVAKQLNAPVANDPKMEVLNFHYESICKAIDEFLFDMGRLGYGSLSVDLEREIKAYKGNNPKEKYAIALKHFKTNEGSFTTFLRFNSKEVKAIKQFVENGVLSSNGDIVEALNEVSQNSNCNWELFQYLLNRLPKDINALNKVLENLSLNGPNAIYFLKLVIDKGARPTSQCLMNAVGSIEIRPGGAKHLEFLLKYCDSNIREAALKQLEQKYTLKYSVQQREIAIAIINPPKESVCNQ